MARRSSVVRASGRPPLVAVVGVLAILLAVWAAAAPYGVPAGPQRAGPLDRARGDVPVFSFNTGCGWLCLSPSTASSQVTTSDRIAAVLGWASVTLVAAGAVFCLAVVLRALAPLLTSREEPGLAPAVVPALDLDRIARTVTEATAERLDALMAGTPGEGIIAAWAHLEGSLQDAGVPLPVSRTSSEVSLEVLSRFTVDPEPVHSLAALFREARWSRHRLTEHDRAAAASAYREMDADLSAQLCRPVSQGVPQAGGEP